MGSRGRGRRRAAVLAGAGGLGGAGVLPPGNAQPVQPVVVQPGQPVPAITVQQLQGMTPNEFATYMTGLKSTPIDPQTYYNNNWDTQRLVANMPELNKAPQVVDPQTFAGLPGQTIYRTVNMSGPDSAVDICGRTMMSDVTTIGEGRMGDGFYFHASKSGSQVGYGKYRGDVTATATMSAKLNSNARVVSESALRNMLMNESATVRNAVNGMRSGGGWSGSGMMAYALWKGYNVVQGGQITNVIDRSAATWSSNVEAWK